MATNTCPNCGVLWARRPGGFQHCPVCRKTFLVIRSGGLNPVPLPEPPANRTITSDPPGCFSLVVLAVGVGLILAGIALAAGCYCDSCDTRSVECGVRSVE